MPPFACDPGGYIYPEFAMKETVCGFICSLLIPDI
jgi:hypothetical protein